MAALTSMVWRERERGGREGREQGHYTSLLDSTRSSGFQRLAALRAYFNRIR
jgi:hypothetical protein